MEDRGDLGAGGAGAREELAVRAVDQLLCDSPGKRCLRVGGNCRGVGEGAQSRARLHVSADVELFSLAK